jgi:hypothetical protein
VEHTTALYGQNAHFLNVKGRKILELCFVFDKSRIFVMYKQNRDAVCFYVYSYPYSYTMRT